VVIPFLYAKKKRVVTRMGGSKSLESLALSTEAVKAMKLTFLEAFKALPFTFNEGFFLVPLSNLKINIDF
jgi:hypothetical protein